MADTTLQLIKTLPPELREKILKEHIKIKIKEREDLGWQKINSIIFHAPFCKTNEQIVKCLYCPKCDDCDRNDLCNLCKKNGIDHYLNYPPYCDFTSTYFEDSNYRSWYNSWREGEESFWKDIIVSTAEKFKLPHLYSIPI